MSRQALAAADGLEPVRAETLTEGCHLCGLPLGPSSPDEAVNGAVHRFCCPGCRQVFLILSSSPQGSPADFRETELFRACAEAGIIPGGLPRSGEASTPARDQELPSLGFSFRVDGMWCPACGWLIEEVLRKTRGVVEPAVSFFTDAVRLKYLPDLITPEEIRSRVRALGYGIQETGAKKPGEEAKRDLLVRLGVSAILTMNVMMLSAALYYGFVGELTPAVRAYFSYPILAMSLPVLFYGAMPILKRAWVSLRFGAPSMDTLISLSALSAFVYSIVQMLRGSIHLYFDTATMLVTILLLGRYIEVHTRERVFASMTPNLSDLAPRKIRLMEGPMERWVAAAALRPGDRFLVKAGERVALDGRVSACRGFLDQSAIFGEPTPVPKGHGDDVRAGSLVADGELTIIAAQTGGENSLTQMAGLIESALERKDSAERRADSVGRVFVPGILGLTVVIGIVLFLLHLPADEILLRCLTVLVISCPCALGIAAPLAKVAAIGLGRRKGILVKNPEALDRIPSLDVMVLDKTGTVTKGRFTFHRVVCEGVREKDVFAAIAPLEAGSPHFLAREIKARAERLGLVIHPSPDVEEREGLGVTGTVAGRKVFAGNRRLAALLGTVIPDRMDAEARQWEEAAMTIIFFGWDGETKGFLVLGDPVRREARELIDWLTRKGVTTFLLSGDSAKTTASIAALLGIKKHEGQKTPAEKAEIVRDLQRRGHRVGMVGDGINDGAALAAADVAYALGAGNDILAHASDLIMPGASPRTVIDAFDLARRYRRTVRQNLIFAFLYNATAIPIAAAGLLNPLIAVAAMFLSSLTVTGNALRVSRRPFSH